MTAVATAGSAALIGLQDDPVNSQTQIANLTAQLNNTLGANTPNTISNNGNVTLNASTLLAGVIVRQGNGNNNTGAFTDTTDSAANICSALQSAAPAIPIATTAMRVRVINANTNGNMTIAPGAGVTMAGVNGGSSNVVFSNNWRDYLVTFGSNANVVTFTSIGQGVN